ncbi:hypothetical protein [Klebsiella oxytoca]
MPGYWRVYLWYQANNLLDLKVSNEREAEVGILAYPMVGKIGHNYH